MDGFHLEMMDEPAPVDLQTITDGLNAASTEFAPPYEKRPLTLLYRNDGRLLGGLVGSTVWGWLYINLLWVDKSQRNAGLGRQLVLAAEAEAVRRGCHAAFLNTFSFQARGFYEKLDYTVFGQLDDYPPGHQRIYMQKRLK
ncbi:MAG: GNAT family N-acetyltransferase [Anaerolineae bacterium]